MSTPHDSSDPVEPTVRPVDSRAAWVTPGPPAPEPPVATSAGAAPPSEPVEPRPSGSARRRGDGFAMAALFLGLAGLVVATIPFVCFAAFPIVLAGAVCGIIGGVRGTSRLTESFLGLGACGLALVVAALIAVSTFQVIPLLGQGFDDAGGWESLGEELDPLAEPYVVPDPVEERGSGDQTVSVEPVDGVGLYGYALVTAQGTGPFRVTGLNDAGDEVEYLIDVIGPYDGAVLWNVSPSTEVSAFRIEADEAWSLSLRSTDEIPEAVDGGTRRGAGDAVFWYSGESTSATLTGDGESPVWMWSDAGPREGLCPAFESPTCSGPLVSDYGTYLQVYADTGWSLKVGDSIDT